MKKTAIFLFLISYTCLFSQSLSVFDIDTASFPVMKAKFFAFDADGKQILNLSATDFEVKENGISRKVLNVSCPAPKPPVALSSVLVMDVSGSMGGTSIALAQEGARAWINGLPLGKSECAITSFDTKNYFVQDFTTDKNKLENKIIDIYRGGGTDYNAAFTSPMAGGILVAKTGKYKKVIVILSDGQPNFEPNTQEIINQAVQNGITVYSVTLGYKCPQCLIDITEKTGGQWFENVTTEEQARLVYLKILQISQSSEPCSIEWESEPSCVEGNTNVELRISDLNLTAKAGYQSPSKSLVKLEFNPTTVKFPDPIVGVKSEQKVVVTALNADFTVTSITGSNPAFVISPNSFTLKSGQSIEITVSYFPADSSYNYCRFDIDCSPCPARLYVSGGWKGKKPTIRTLKLIHPNGGKIFVAGSDTVVTWEGVSPDEPVKIEYSTNNGLNWTIIADNAIGLSYNWQVPKTPSNQCLARVTAAAKIQPSSFCNNPDVELCSKIWMGCNLDVEYYRNGEPIRHAQTNEDWIDAGNKKEGAWCYYNNSDSLGQIYGKLYNMYAVNDSRGLAPEGWHISSDAEWTELENCLGGLDIAGGKLKSTGTIEGGDGLWGKPNFGATNESGFSALPGSFRQSTNGSFGSIGNNGYWWSGWSLRYFISTYRSMWRLDTGILITYTHEKGSGFSVRCVRDY